MTPFCNVEMGLPNSFIGVHVCGKLIFKSHIKVSYRIFLGGGNLNLPCVVVVVVVHQSCRTSHANSACTACTAYCVKVARQQVCMSVVCIKLHP